MFRRDGDVFLLGTAISAPIPNANAKTTKTRSAVDQLTSAVRGPAAGRVEKVVPYSHFRARCKGEAAVAGIPTPEETRMLLPITLTMAGAAALINVWLAWRCGQVRHARKILTGDGGDPMLIARMRAQANFVENAPFFLILLALIEFARGPRTWLWLVGIAFLLARILHAFGMDQPKANLPRGIGAGVTLAVLIGLALYALALPYGLA